MALDDAHFRGNQQRNPQSRHTVLSQSSLASLLNAVFTETHNANRSVLLCRTTSSVVALSPKGQIKLSRFILKVVPFSPGRAFICCLPLQLILREPSLTALPSNGSHELEILAFIPRIIRLALCWRRKGEGWNPASMVLMEKSDIISLRVCQHLSIYFSLMDDKR